MLCVRLFGGLALELDGRETAPPARRSGRALLAWLALHPGLHARADLAALLWPDVLDSSARTSLRSAVASVRQALGPSAERHLVASRDRVGLAAGGSVWVDALAVADLVRRDKPEHALELVHGTLLQGLDADWVLAAREAHHELLDGALAALVARARAADDANAAIQHARQRVALDGLAEPAARELMQCLADAGDRASAVAVFARLSERLQRELRMAPSRETRDLARELRVAPATVGTPERSLPAALRQRHATPLVGRDAELASLGAALARAIAGEPRVCLIAGAPGAGKTRLVGELAFVAARDGVAVLAARCVPAAAPYEPVIDALRDALRRDTLAPGDLPDIAGELRGLVPELEQVATVTPAVVGDPGGEADRVVRALVQTTLALARNRAALLVVDDLHNADIATLGLLEQLVASTGSQRLLLVVTHRDGHQAPGRALAATLRRLRRLPITSTFALPGLGASDLAALAHAHKLDFTPAQLAELHRRTSGNALFVEELLRRAATAGGAAALDPATTLPERLTDLILDDLERLGPAARRALSIAAIAADPFSLELIFQAGGDSRESVLDALDEATRAQVIRELPDTAGRYELRHPLVRDVIAAQLTATRRAELHRRLGEALDRQPDPPLRDIARHLVGARDLVAPGRAAQATAHAADAATRAHAHEEAAALLAQGVTAAAGPRQRCELLLALGHARIRAAQPGTARAPFAEAATSARALDAPTLLADAALGLCAVPFFPGHEAVDALATAALRDALRGLPDDETARRALLLAQLARELHFADADQEAPGLRARALRDARACGDPDALASALQAVHLGLAATGEPHERLVVADEIIALGARAERPALTLRGRVLRAVDLLELGNPAAAAEEQERLELLTTDLHQPAYQWWPALWRAARAIAAGHLEDSERLIIQAHAIGAQPFGEAADLERDTQLLWLAHQRGTLGDLAPRLAVLTERYPALGALRCAHALAQLHAGRTQTARRILHDLARDDFAALRHDAAWLVGAHLLAETCTKLTDTETAHTLRKALAPYRARHAVTPHGSLWLGSTEDAIRSLSPTR